MSGLTYPQRDCLAAIQELCAEGVSPTYQEIADRAGLKSKSRVSIVVGQLVERGLLRHRPFKTRSLEVVTEAAPLATRSTQDLLNLRAEIDGILTARSGQ